MKTTPALLAGLAFSVWLCCGAESPAPIKNRLKENLDAGKKQTIVVYGTSLTSDGAWVRQLKAVLKRSYPRQVIFYNCGGSGKNSDWGLSNFDDVLKRKPDALFIEFSINDAVASFNLSQETSRKNLETMISMTKQQYPECEIIIQVMGPAIGNRLESRPKYAEYQEVYREVARKQGLLLIDHMPAWEALLNKSEEEFKKMVPDGLHPSPEGCSACVTPTIIRMLDLKDNAKDNGNLIETADLDEAVAWSGKEFAKLSSQQDNPVASDNSIRGLCLKVEYSESKDGVRITPCPRPIPIDPKKIYRLRFKVLSADAVQLRLSSYAYLAKGGAPLFHGEGEAKKYWEFGVLCKGPTHNWEEREITFGPENSGAEMEFFPETETLNIALHAMGSGTFYLADLEFREIDADFTVMEGTADPVRPGAALKRKAKDTLCAVEMNRGETLEFELASGKLVRIKLVSTNARVLSKTQKQLKSYQSEACNITSYGFSCVLNINGKEHALEREVGTQRSFYEPWEIDGVRIWFDAVQDIYDFLADHDFGGRPRKNARFALQDASLRICPETLYPWCPLPEGGLKIENCYHGRNCWLGPFEGTGHGGLDINHPKGTPLWTPLDIHDHYYFNSLAMGDNNNRWRGIHTWPNGAKWIMQAHHMSELTVKEHDPIKKGQQFAVGAGVLSGGVDHDHFIFKIQDYGRTILLDPWILFWQMYKDASAR